MIVNECSLISHELQIFKKKRGNKYRLGVSKSAKKQQLLNRYLSQIKPIRLSISVSIVQTKCFFPLFSAYGRLLQIFRLYTKNRTRFELMMNEHNNYDVQKLAIDYVKFEKKALEKLRKKHTHIHPSDTLNHTTDDALLSITLEIDRNNHVFIEMFAFFFLFFSLYLSTDIDLCYV